MQAIDILKNMCVSLKEITAELEDLPQNQSDECQDRLVLIESIINDIVDKEEVAELGILANEIVKIEAGNSDKCCQETIDLVSIMLKKLAEEMDSEDWETEISDADADEIYTIQDVSPYENIWYSSPNDNGNEMLLLNCTNLHEIEKFWRNENAIGGILLRCIHLIDMKTSYTGLLLAPKGITQDKITSRIEFIKLNAVLEGKEFPKTEPYNYNRSNLLVKYDDSIEYTQFKDIIDIMNEYNIQKHILDKYLRIYQVVENFMYKFQICDLCEQLNYSKITVRDFKAISDRLAKNEMDSLVKLLFKSGEFIVDGDKLKNKLVASWQSKVSTNVSHKTMVKNVIELLAICNKDGEFISVDITNPDEIMRVFGKLVYNIRCSIVHNKVNDYHVSYFNLNSDLKWVLEEYIMPNMEMLVYALMLNENSIVMYKGQSLRLY